MLRDAAKDVFGLTREELVEFLGEPDAVGGMSRKYRTPSTYKYCDLEFQKDGRLHTIYREDVEGRCVLNLTPDNLDWNS